MPSVLVKDVIYRASVLLQDVAPQFQRWPERELVSWLNDGQMAVAKYLPTACARVDAIKLKPGTRQSIERIAASDVKPGDGSAAAQVFGNFLNDVIRNMGADGLTPGRAVRLVSREVLDSQFSDWHTRQGTGKIESFVFDPRTPKNFYVSPAVPAGGTAVWVEVAYLANPVLIANTGTPGSERYGMDSTDATTITVDDKYVDDLVNYILARAYMKDAEFSANAANANSYATMFLNSLNAQVQALTGNNPNLQVLPMNPALPAAAQ